MSIYELLPMFLFTEGVIRLTLEVYALNTIFKTLEKGDSNGVVSERSVL